MQPSPTKKRTMYASYYKLRKEPFHITPDPEFLFLSPSHKEALGSIIYGVGHRKGFVQITGEVGVGKTTILRSYLEDIDRSKLKIIYIFNSNVSFQGLLKTIFREMDIIDLTDDPVEMVNQLQFRLIEEYKKGITVILIIDEAQNMPVETLENIRMLSNLETSTDKLIQIVFSGQPEFERKLERKELRQLKQRIAVKADILPLTREESRDYIMHRLNKVGNGSDPLFTNGALRKIIRESRGIPRIINILCENSFITAMGYQKKRVTAKIAQEVISDFSGKKETRALKISLVSLVAVLAILAAALLTTQTATVGPADRENANRILPDRDVATPPTASVDTGPTEPPGEAGAPPSPAARIVKRGDTLSRLAEAEYGYSNRRLLQLVKENNPGIQNINRIEIGQRILFPEINR